MSVKQYNLLIKYDSLLAARVYTSNRYYIFFLMFYKDYFVYKLVSCIMQAGNKRKAWRIFLKAMQLLKKSVGFQPFFLFKHIVFRMRQIFKLNTVTIRNKVTYWPVFLPANKQMAYGISHLVYCADRLRKDEQLSMADALHIVLLNCFIKA